MTSAAIEVVNTVLQRRVSLSNNQRAAFRDLLSSSTNGTAGASGSNFSLCFHVQIELNEGSELPPNSNLRMGLALRADAFCRAGGLCAHD
jgi:hypothetical protein